jgi:hypothetical protein
MTKLVPKYSIWDAVQATLALALKVADDLKALREQYVEAARLRALGLDDIEIQYDGERTFSFVVAKHGGTVIRSFVLPIPIYQGVYQDGGPPVPPKPIKVG